MTKKEPQITVTTVFDGGLQAKDIFADLIIKKIITEPGMNSDDLTIDSCSARNISFIKIRYTCFVTR